MQIKKLYQQIMDLAPHLTKLIPIAEHLLTGTSFSSAFVGGAGAAAAVDLTEVHGRLDEASKANTALLRQLQDQTVQMAGVEEEVKRLRMALEHSERRVESVEREVASLGLWVKALGSAAVLMLAVVAVMMYVLHARS
jgi:DNA repair exonuclease SbcCD ATPase subunit